MGLCHREYINPWWTVNLVIMSKEEIIEKLRGLGIQTDNAYPKSTFVYDGEVVVGLYEREMKKDFYFFNNYDKKIYKWKVGTSLEYSTDPKTGKYLIPMVDCSTVWEDKPYVELVDEKFSAMTLRHYAAIHLKVPDSGIPWLDEMIRKVANV